MFEIKQEGLRRAMNLMKTLEHMGSAIKAVECNSKARAEGGSSVTNAEIADWLAESGRDFFSVDDEIMRTFDGIMVETMEEELTKQTVMRAKSGKSAKSAAQATAAKAFMAAAEEYKRVIVARIEYGITADGGEPDELSPEYKKAKQREFGFTKPIGKATGQLLDNLAPGSRNIKLRK